MAQKHLLHELLKEDQEPFLLKNYISDRLSKLKRPSSPKTSSLQVKKQKQPIHQNSNFPINLCKNACFLSTPDIKKSPFFEFASPAKSPCRSPNTIFLHIPARTAAILLEAALRIQKQSKTKTHNKNNGFGLLGSLFKRLKQRSRNRKREIEGSNNNNSVKVKDILRFEFDSSVGKGKAFNGNKKEQENIVCCEKGIKDVVVTGVSSCEVGFTCSCNGRPSSAVWSESNEDNKSLDMETSSTSGQSYDDSAEEKENANCACFDDNDGAFFCESPFRFVLQRSPSSSSGRRTPEFASPASSPSRTEEKESNGADSLNKFQSGEEEEEKEQCSPVSVLDPPFEDDDDVHENDDEEDGFDLECSYANVQRAKQQLLYKLSRFEKLAELDPVELERRMLDQEDECETFIGDDECEDDDSDTLCEEKDMREIVFEILCHSSVSDRQQVPEDLRRLVSDLIMEQGRELHSSEDRDMVIRRVCKRLELWKEVESNTIDMMIEEDFSREELGWKKNVEQIRELAGELEHAIFGFLVEEFSVELVC